MKILGLGQDGLLEFTVKQLVNYFPDGVETRSRISPYVEEALFRLSKSVNAVKMWRQDEFNYLHSTQYCMYLYFLSNTIWRRSGDSDVCTRLFLLNKALNGIDCFYEIEMPDIFFIGHSVGIVLAKAVYSDYFVVLPKLDSWKKSWVCSCFRKWGGYVPRYGNNW